MQADLLHEALGGGHPWRHMKNAAAAASAKEVRLLSLCRPSAKVWKGCDYGAAGLDLPAACFEARIYLAGWILIRACVR